MNASEIKKALKGLPHIKKVWVDANGGYYTAPIRGAQLLDLSDEVAELESTSETLENLTQLPPETATNKRKRK